LPCTDGVRQRRKGDREPGVLDLAITLDRRELFRRAEPIADLEMFRLRRARRRHDQRDQKRNQERALFHRR
jgi:hypothetical protein